MVYVNGGYFGLVNIFSSNNIYNRIIQKWSPLLLKITQNFRLNTFIYCFSIVNLAIFPLIPAAHPVAPLGENSTELKLVVSI